MAIAIAFELGGGYGDLVKAFLSANPLPPNGLSVSRIDVLETGKNTFLDLLNVVSATTETELVLVVHGFINGTGLALLLGAYARSVATAKNVQTLSDLATSGKEPTDRQLAELGATKDQVGKLIAAIKKVRQKNLMLIEWRSCDLGRKIDTLNAFRECFGANTMGAPKMENIFGRSPVSIRPLDQVPARFQSDFNAYYYEDKMNPTVINYLRLDPAEYNWPVEGAMFAAKQSDVDDFVKKHINASARAGRTSVPIHALWKEADMDHPLDAPVPILPLDADYAPNITYVRGP